jgi:8-oxo-dGTP pyrophosphatase MutT (NUDIX family)
MDKKTRKAQVVIAVVDPECQNFSLLLMQTNEKRGSFWQNVTGKIESDETYEEGALREAMEETGLSVESIVDIVDLKISHDFIDQKKRDVHEKGFLFVLDKKWDVKMDPSEHQNFKWIALNELNREVVKYEGNFEALEKARSLLKQWGV